MEEDRPGSRRASCRISSCWSDANGGGSWAVSQYSAVWVPPPPPPSILLCKKRNNNKKAAAATYSTWTPVFSWIKTNEHYQSEVSVVDPPSPLPNLHTHTHIYTHVHTCTYTVTSIYTHTHTHIYKHTYVYTHTSCSGVPRDLAPYLWKLSLKFQMSAYFRGLPASSSAWSDT